ncbi:AcrR family transcriptional regulator [Paenibacillus shirakamiensis]|uniref:AcrR family transcriptional regulator n=1 Tax=Paenibacillus shirakamiensis TaxID=1265935 RepID=A0ABS4JIR0_9BACL|nr:TetR family transcriptional regulator [Paenibacillus shirakamiensis]MBP2001590.1 AcrR family transcriptional regulator [Paenibacillus shirakamiensis]
MHNADQDLDVKIRIMLSAKRLFAKQGFDRTSVRQICEDAGANVALISYYFGGKEKVFEEILEQFFPGNEIALTMVEMRPLEGLRTLLREVIAFSSTDDPDLGCIIQQEMTLDSPRKGIVTHHVQPVWDKVRMLLEQGREEGIFHFDSLNYTLLMVMGTALAHKSKYNYIAELEDNEKKHIPDQSIRFILRGLGVKEA